MSTVVFALTGVGLGVLYVLFDEWRKRRAFYRAETELWIPEEE